MYACLINYGIKPWEFGELTFPWLRMLMDKGQVQESEEALHWKVHQARAVAKEFASKMKGSSLG